MRIEAFSIDRGLRMRVGPTDLPDPAADEVLVRVEWAGLCGSDLHVMRTGAWVTDWPATLGHELYGRVAEAPAASGLAPGTAVVADSRLPCRTCAACASDSDHCSHPSFLGEARPGAFATHCALAPHSLHPVPETLDGATAVLAEPLAVVMHGLSHLTAEPRHAAILGHGPIGALVHAELRRRHPTAEVAVAEPAGLRAQLAAALGAAVVDSAKKLGAGEHDVVVDAAGYRDSLADAVRLGAPGGHVLVLGISEHPAQLTPLDLVESRLTLTGSNAFQTELPEAIALLATEGWRYAPVVSDAIALSELPSVAARQLDAPDAVKVLIRP